MVDISSGSPMQYTCTDNHEEVMKYHNWYVDWTEIQFALTSTLG